MEQPARAKTDSRDIALHWAMELRRAEKEAKYAPEGKRGATEKYLRHAKKQFNRAVDVLLGKMP